MKTNERGRGAKRAGRGKSRPYHHGDLRSALLEEALGLIREQGPEGFTLRELARRLGVSHAAPYRHFSDRKALITAVAALGCDELVATIKEGLEAAGPDLRERFLGAGYAYVRFALEKPAHFHAMFGSPEVDTADPAYAVARGRCWAILLGFIRAGQEAGLLVEGEPEVIATPVWAMHHGLACLAAAGTWDALGMAALKGIVDGAHAALLDGLLVRGGERGGDGARRAKRGGRSEAR